MQPQKYPGTKKRPLPFGFGQGQKQSAHKSDTDLFQQFGTPGGFDDNLDDFKEAKIDEENEDAEFLDHQDDNN